MFISCPELVRGLQRLDMLDLDWQCRFVGEVLFYMFFAGDRHISYLPLAHIYERVTLYGITHVGTSIGFYR
jgi:long-subunit acyl-CoA synthetase (AMP-forming)